MKDTIYREDAIKSMAKAIWHYPNELYTGLNSYEACEALAKDGLMNVPSAEPKTGMWIEGRDKRFVKCSKCGMETTKNSLKGIALFGKNEPNFCPCCGADMRTKETNCDYERAVEQLEHDILYESTFNQDDGSM